MPAAPEPDTDSRPVKVILAAVATSLLLASLGQTIVATALPVIVADLGGLDHITWVITAYLLASTVGAPVYGKLGDLYGRKIVLQGAILIFLTGSVVAGLAQDMLMMVIGRAVQGLGGGGLIVVAMTVVADVLPPRERGKAQGIMGSVFGVSTVIGPLIGGFLVEQFGWHWIFFFNLPIGLIAFVVIALVLDTQKRRTKPAIDYFGAATLAAMLGAIVVATSLGGKTFGWTSTPMLLLYATAVLGFVGFLVAESRAREPVMPLSLFTNNNFLVANGVGFIVGVAMFGAITFLPLYLQVVRGISPTQSGFFMMPMMLGLLGSSMLSGWVMSRTGRYKLLPILSTLVLLTGMVLFHSLSLETPVLLVAVYMFVVGIGIGPVMSVGVAAIQNAVPANVLGVATASASMFRQVGGSLGVSVFGAIFSAGLASRLGGMMPAGVAPQSMSAEQLGALPAPVRETILNGFVEALHPIFMTGALAALLAFGLGFLLKEIPLSTRLHKPEPEAEIEAVEEASAAAGGAPSGSFGSRA